MVNINEPQEIIAVQKCGDLFSNDTAKAKEEYRKLALMYHPDRNKSEIAEQAFKHINLLYAQAEKLLENGQWAMSNCINFVTNDGKRRQLKYLKECIFELGVQYIASTVIAFVFEADKRKYYDNMCNRVNTIKYENKDMEKEFVRYIPKVIDKFETTDGKLVAIVKKSNDLVRLQDLYEYYTGSIPDRHVAWVISRLNNICCFLEYNNISHNGISLDNCYVSPQYHSIALLGGWWYAVWCGEKMLGTQKQIYDIMAPIDKTNKVGSINTDLESIKLVGRITLGSNKAPNEFNKWIESGSSNSAKREFEKWSQALDKSYGVRRFIKMEVGEKDIYK